MASFKNVIILVAVCLAIASVQSAPASDSETSTTPMTTSTEAPASSTPLADSSTSSARSVSEESMAVSSAQDQAHLSNTSFTCYHRQVGYYADIESSCKVYHFCMLGDYNGQEVYQRISYLCLNETIFDQQQLDCVEPTKISGPCSESAKHYDESNSILRKAIIGKPSSETEKDDITSAGSTSGEASSSTTTTTTTTPTTTTTTTTAAPSRR